MSTPPSLLRAAFLLSAVFCIARTAQAESRVALSWSAPTGCPSQTQVSEGIERLLGARPQAQHAKADIAVSKLGARWQAVVRVDVSETSRVRTLDADACTALAKAAELLVALTLDPEALRPAEPAIEPVSPSSAVSTPSEPAPPATAKPSVRLRPLPAQPDRRQPSPEGPRWQLSVAAATAAGFGVLPDPTLGIELAVGARRGVAAAEAFGQWNLPSNEHYQAASAIGADFASGAFGARGCAELLWQFAPCVEGSWSVVQAAGVGASSNREVTHLSPRAGVGLRWTRALAASWHLRVDGWARAPLMGPIRYETKGVGLLYEASAVAFGLQIGLERRIGK